MITSKDIKPIFSGMQAICLLALIVILSIVLFFVYRNDMDNRAKMTRDAIAAFNEKRWHDGVLLSVCASTDNPEIQVGLGLCRMAGAGGLAKDEAAAYKLFKSAAAQGNLNGHIFYGVCLYSGTGLPGIGNGDKTEAIKWFKKPAEKGYPYAQYVLGVYYLYVDGKDKNPEMGIKLLEKAAGQEWAAAEHVLGLCYYGGIGVKFNLEKAKWYLTKAVEHGNSQAAFDIKSIVEERTEEERYEFSKKILFWEEFSLCRFNK